MRKYSNYFKRMMIYFLVLVVGSCIVPSQDLAICMVVLGLIFYYAAIMAPAHEKYKDIDIQDAVDRWIEQQNEIERGK